MNGISTDPKDYAHMPAMAAALQDIADKAAARKAEKDLSDMHPTNRRLVEIMENNFRPHMSRGMGGFLQILTFDPSRLKRMAAEKLLYMRANREVLKRQGFNHRKADAKSLAAVRKCLAAAQRGGAVL